MTDTSNTLPTDPVGPPEPTQRMEPSAGNVPPPAAPPPGGGASPPPSGKEGGFWQNASTGVKVGVVIGIVAAIGLLLWLFMTLLGGGKPQPTPVPPLTPIPTTEAPTPESGKPSLVATSTTFIYAGPSMEYPQVGLLQAGLSAEVVGTNQQRDWWAIKFPEGPNGTGWVPDNVVSTSNVGNVPVLQPPPLPTPTLAPPIAITDWKGEYFDNPNLQGKPVVVRNDERINFNWGGNPPAEGVPGTRWSARWTIRREVAAGTYTIDVWVDDGVRVYVDNNLVIDGWKEGGARHYTANVNVTKGEHEVRVEYFQAEGDSLIQVSFGYTPGAYPDWKAEYFDNPNVDGEPIVVRNDREINFDWGTGAPAPGLPADNFSVRWSRQAQFNEGDYLITVEVEGGVRLWLDGRLLIDEWTGGPFRTLTAQSGLIQAGPHDLRVDYFKNTGRGRIRVSWEPISGQPPTAIIDLPNQPIQVGQPVQFSGQRSTAAPGRTIVQYEWDFGNGLGSNDVNPVVAFNTPGQYVITLKVYDDLGQMGQSSVNVTVEAPAAQPPVAVIAGPTSGQVGEMLTFSGADSQGDIVRYLWDFGDGGTAEGIQVSHVFQQPGIYSVTLTVTDRNGLTNSTVLNVTIAGAPAPTETPIPEPTPTQPPAPEPTPTPPGQDLLGVTWKLTGIAKGRGAPQPPLPNSNITLVFNPDGTYTGFGGCSQYEGQYGIPAPNQLNMSIPNLVPGASACPPEMQNQEVQFLELLGTVSGYSVAFPQMQLQAGGKGTLYFEAVP